LLRGVIATTTAEVESLRGAWEHLYGAGTGTMFQSFSWNQLAVRRLRAAPCVAFAQSDSGIALIPAAIEQGRLGFVGDVLFDYRDVLATGTRGVLRHAWSQLAKLALPLSVRGLRAIDTQRDWECMGFSLQPFVPAPRVLTQEISADEFTCRHSRSSRLVRRLTTAGAELRQYSGSSSELVRYIYTRKAEQRGDSVFCDAARIDFMVAVAAQVPAACEIFTLEAGSSLVAALVCFRDRATRRFYTICYDRAWAAYSPGAALVYEITRQSLVEGLDADYMTGEQPHKARLATSRQNLFRVEATAAELCGVSRLPAPLPTTA